MIAMWRLILTSIVAFAATNIDDILVLVIVFSRVRSKRPHRRLTYVSIMAGQFIGFTLLVAVSMLGYLLGTFIDLEYLGLMGFLPIGLGVYDYMKMCICPEHEEHDDLDEEEEEEGEKDKQQAKTTADGGESGATVAPQDGTASEAAGTDQPPPPAPQAQQSSTIIEGSATDTEPLLGPKGKETQAKTDLWDDFFSHSVETHMAHAFSGATCEVAWITVANGVDNISVYVPLFSSITNLDIVVVIVIFYIMLVVWFILSFFLVRAPGVAETLARYGDMIAPAVFILLGIYIFWSCGTFGLFEKWANAI